MAASSASYDQLLKQVEALKMENSNLRQELEDNSNHLTQLETEASSMKEVLKQLQGSIEDEALALASAGQIDLLERLKELNLECANSPAIKLRPKMSLHSYGSREGSMSGRSGECSPVPVGSIPRRGLISGSKESTGYLEELEKERSLLLAEIEKEEKEKDWYYAQLQNLTKRIDNLPLTENFSLQTDMTRRQLEYEARQIRSAMEEQLGTCQDMEKRAQMRVVRIQQIEKEMLRLRQHLHSQAAEPEKSSQTKHEQAVSKDADGPSDCLETTEASVSTTGSGQGSGSRVEQDTNSVMSCSNSYSVPRRLTNHLGTKVTEDSRLQVEMVYSLLSMLGTHDKDDMSRTLLAMSSSQDSCIAMRQSGCLPLLIQLLHGNDKDSVLLGNSRGSKEARARASAALHNIIHSQPDDKRGRRETRVLHLLEQIRAYCETCWEWQEAHEQGVDQDKNPMPSPVEHQICPAVCVLMKLSFDEEHRHAMNELGGLQAIAELLQVDCEMYGLTDDHYSVTLRRYAGMALTNLTFGDVANKATLCSMKGCMRAMVAQLKSESEDLQQVIASVLRNLSWRADVNSKKILREVGSVSALMECALEVKKESTLKSVLSALWNLSAHCTENKADICTVCGALAFLVSTLTYRSQTNTLAIIESGGGILRNVSSLIATNEDHRQILRENNCLQTLLQHLKSHSLTIVSNACGTLWNLSARNAKDQESLWDMGAVSMLKNLIHSKHKMIAMGSAAALRNLMANRPAKYKDANIMSPGSSLPSLHVRKQKALEAELDAQQLSETFDNIDTLSPKTSHRNRQRHKQGRYSEYVLDSGRHNDDGVCRSESFNTGNMTVLSPYVTSSKLHNSSRDGRGTIDSSRPEKERNMERDRRGPDTASFPPSENVPDPSKRMGRQAPASTAQIAKVMEEVSSIHLSSDDRNSPSDLHCVPDDRAGMKRGSSSHPHSNICNYSKSETSNRTASMPYGKTEYRRSSNDSLNSVSSSDGYGKRGQMKPSIESYSEDDESKFCNYEKYPADLANKIHNANHLEDNDAELDTPINYSLKYSDEQLNSGRQSPSQNEQWARQKHIVEEEMKRNEHKQSRTQPSGYSIFCENTCSGEETHMKFQPRFGQSDCSYTSRAHNNSDQIRVDSEHRMNQKINPSLCPVDDYEDEKPTNYSERYSEEEQPEEEEDRPTNYSMKFTEEEHHVEQPIDYSLKYATEVPASSQSQSFIYSKSPSVQNTTKDRASNCGSTPSSKINATGQQRRLHPSPAQTRTTTAPAIQKSATCKTPSINQETMQTYCVEDTPICFSRCSSLSSLSSEDEMEGRGQAKHVADDGTTLQIIDLKENHGQLSVDTTIGEASSTSHHTRMKQNRLQATNVAQPDTGRQKAVEFSSGAKSPSKSGAQTPKSPPEHYVQETPLVFSRCSSVSSLGSFESQSIASSIQSEPCSEMVSGVISPSDLPDSPGQTMPPSRSKTPPPQPAQLKRETHKIKDQTNVKSREIGQCQAAVNEAVQRVQIPQDGDCLMHFATENTPDGFSCASSLSALSLDEPFIQKDLELTVMPPVYEDDHKNDESVKEDDGTEKNKCKAEKVAEAEKDILDDEDDDDDIDILEECINSAMPTKSSSKAKKTAAGTTSRMPPPVARKPSQLPVYKLLSNQNRVNSQKHVSFNHDIFREDMPRVYCVEGTPINFSTATSLSDLTIESPPNELVNSEANQPASESTVMEKRDTIPTEGRNMNDAETSKGLTGAQPGQDDKMEEGDILAECINSAMPKGKSHKPYRVKKLMNQVQHVSTSSNNANQQEVEKNPTSPMKPLSQNNEYKNRSLQRSSLSDLQSSFNAEGNCTEHRKDMEKGSQKQATKNIAGDFQDKPPGNDNRVRGGFVFDSPHHYTPIEGTPYCFSRNDSLSSLDFDDDDTDLTKEKAELKKDKGRKESVSNDAKNCNNKQIPISQQPSDRVQPGQKSVSGRGQSNSAPQRHAAFSQIQKDNNGRETVTDEKMQNFAIEDTPVCFSRNSSLSSLSDIDQENNNKKAAQHSEQGEHTNSQVAVNRPPASGYAPKSFHVEDTPVCFSRNSSLSSLSIDSEDDLLQECISSAMPKKKNMLADGKSNWENTGSDTSAASVEEMNEPMNLRDQVQSPISEQAFSPDSESFDWKAIQEGANSIVSSLHQAAACLSRQGSSDSDSILSLKSGISLGSPFHLTPDQEEKPFTSNKGPKIVKPGEKIASDNKKNEEENVKAIRGGKRVYKSLITGKARSNVETPTHHPKHSQQANMPMISRGRTMIHIPGVRNSSPSTSPIPKMPPKTITSKSPNTGQNSNHSRGIKTPIKLESSPIGKQMSAQGASSSKGSSRSGSRDSTPSRLSQQSLSRPMPSPGRNSISPGRNGISPSSKISQLPRTSSPCTASAKPSGSGKMSYTSPGRPLNQQAASKQAGLGKGTSSLTRSESSSKGLSQSASSTAPGKRVELSRMSSTKSSGSESDRSERPTLMRQSTFIKEAPSPTLRRKLEESNSFESLSPPSRPTSPSRSQTQTPVLSPSQHLDVMPSHLPNQASSWRKVPPNQNLIAEQLEERPMRKHDIARSHSESPSRLPVNRSGTWKREHSKHSSSLPRVSTWRRTGSSSSILSASSESSEKAKSEDEKPYHGSFVHGSKQDKENPVPLRGTWRKIKDNEVPQINSQVQIPSAAHSVESKNLVYQMAPPVSKTEDVWVRIEDCPINNPRPGRSPTGNTPPVIDDFPENTFPNDEEGSGDAQNRPASEQRTPPHGLRMEKCLNSFTPLESPEKKAAEAKSAMNSSTTSPETETTIVTERTPFSSNSSSKHNSPSGTVAARVTPFNYIPSPRKSSTDNSSTRPSQIPTPVNTKRKESSKPEATDSSGAQSPKRHSGSYLVTSV
ncbi:adenomatous polyposis coli protein isoform X4 [Amblyraja radiata]|nr:adenomatous polyposis coli protein isoform X4 [Amblyraja radiata]XP_032873322.1 adenomatous polyposis coli protein isoform X4 [Amblyraja radiata]